MPRPVSNVVLVLDPDRVEHLRETLETWGLEFEDRPHAHFLARDEDATIVAYESGKLVVGGREAQRMARHLAARDDLGVSRPSSSPEPDRVGATSFRPRIGTDEAGKGDYFGPLVVAGVRLEDEDAEDALGRFGGAESKNLPDTEARAMATAIKDEVPTEVVRLDPPKYNDLYDRIGGQNRLLAWAHARCFEDLLEGGDVDLLVTDQFASESVLESALMERGSQVELAQEPRGERDAAIAAASVLARAEFLRGLAELEAEWDADLPTGAGEDVDAAGRALVEEHGDEALPEVAKVHFRTTDRVLG
jgi:ribonuclease HIII